MIRRDWAKINRSQFISTAVIDDEGEERGEEIVIEGVVGVVEGVDL